MATTSIAPKQLPEDSYQTKDNRNSPARSVSVSDTTPGIPTQAISLRDGAESDGPIEQQISSDATKEDWEDDKSFEETALQGLVERLHDKGEKEVARVLKADHLSA